MSEAWLLRRLVSMELKHVLLTGILIVLLVLAWSYIWDRLEKIRNSSRLEGIMACICGLLAVFLWSPGLARRGMTGTTLALSVLKILAVVVTMWAIQYMKLYFSDLAVLFFSLYSYDMKCNLTGFAVSALFLVTYVLLCIIHRRRAGSLKASSLPVLITFFSGQLAAWLFSIFDYIQLKNIYYKISQHYELSYLGKALLLAGITAVMILLICGMIWLLKYLLASRLQQLQSFSQRYREIGYYLLALPIFAGVYLLIRDSLQSVSQDSNSIVRFYLAVLIVVIVITQAFYLKMLYAVVHLKEHLKLQDEQQDNLLLYNRAINQNMQEIREMKHDLKNIFLTMGAFVERSDDRDLKAYYFGHIAPYGQKEIEKNDFYVQMQELKNESLKAFLFYKLTGIMDDRIKVELDTQLDHTVFPKLVDVNVLIRILGIFLDNAWEECQNIEQEARKEGTGAVSKGESVVCEEETTGTDGDLVNVNGISISIREKEQKVSIQIRNPVRKNVLQQGIHAGTTSKGLGRGNGLQIVEKLVRSHRGILWNSYFQDASFVQSLVITWKEY